MSDRNIPSIYPLPAGVGTISSGRSRRRRNPVTGKIGPHKGIDISAPAGTDVFATADGTVTRAEFSDTYGNVIYIRHANGIETRYAHLSSIAPRSVVGRTVTRGQVIGEVGSTGESTGNHLHYEVRKNGVPQNPQNYMDGEVRPSAPGNRERQAEENSSENNGRETAALAEARDIGALSPSSEKNRLNQYRSYTYNFTFGAVTVAASNSRNLEDLELSIQDHCVFDTSGKIKQDGLRVADGVTNFQQRDQLVQGFNENSPGAYDFYVEELTFSNLLEGGPTPTKVEMTIHEPYSINGLYEALHTAAISAGYEQYISTPFCLKIQFQGYRDDKDQVPEIIPNTTRYLIMILTKFEMSVTDEGAKYRCEARADPDLSFGTPNLHLQTMKPSGETVFDVLKSYFKSLNEVSRNNAINTAGENANVPYDQYQISAPLMVTPGTKQDVLGSLIYSPIPVATVTPLGTSQPTGPVDPPAAGPEHNDIVKARIIRNISQNARTTTDQSVIVAAYDAIPASENSPQSDRATPNANPEFQFERGQQIHEAITAIILNSEYVRTDVLQRQLPDAAGNSNGTIIYFKIRMEVDLNAATLDPITNRLTRVHRYIIEPYNVLYTTIPPYDRSTDSFRPLMKKLKRTYYFTYTGKNTDVLKFDLKLNTLFYNALPSSFGNVSQENAARGAPATAASPNINETNLQRQPTSDSTDPRANHVMPIAPNATVGDNLTRGGQSQADPYHRMVDTLHENYLFKTYSNTKIDMDIIGDPYYMVTGPSRNYDLELSSEFETVGGEAPITQGPIYVLILMKNLRDISKNNEPSLAVFRENDYSTWSGIYSINAVKHKFKDGQFTQTLTLLKENGHVLDRPGTPAEGILTRSSAIPGSNVVNDSAGPSVTREGQSSNGADLLNLIGRGAAAVGAAAGVTQAIFANRESGTTDVSRSQLGINSSIDQRSGIVDVNISPSLLNSAAISDTAAAVGMAGTIIGQVANADNASVNLADELASTVPGISRNLRQNVESLPQNSLREVGNAPSGVEILQNPILNDPTGISSRLGIEPSKISGLSQNLASKVNDQLAEIVEILPPNVNLASLESQGLVFKNMSKSDLANLPALQPSSRVMPVADDPAMAPIVDSFGSVEPLLSGLTNLAPLTENSKITNAMGYVSSAITTNEQTFSQSMIDKVDTAQRLVNDVSANAYGVPVSSRIRNGNAITSPSMSELGLGSRESNYGSVGSLVQSSSKNTSQELGMTLAAQFGSRASSSPLTTLIQKTNIRERNT